MPRLAWVAVPLLAALASPAHAWQIESPATTGCHERITAKAIQIAGFPGGEPPPLASDYERRVIHDVPFSFPIAGSEDPWNLALLVGVRNVDIEDHDPIDVAALSSVHNDPAKQDEHCLRHIEDDDSAGNAVARMRCKAFILSEIELALGSGDEIDLGLITEVRTSLKFRDEIKIKIQNYGFHVGRALHGLQDGYTHTFRNPETFQIRTVLNWIEGNIGSDYVEARDGHEHVGGIDDCTRTDAYSVAREEQATEASRAVLAALADSTGGRDGRLQRVSAILDEKLQGEEGCTLENSYCDAPELEITSCSAGGTGVGWLPVAGVLGLFALGGRRRRHFAPAITAGLCGIGLVVMPTLALAQTEPATATPTAANPVPGATETTEGVGSEAPKSDAMEEKVIEREDAVLEALPDPTTKKWGLAANAGAAFDRGALAVSAGARWNPNDCWGFGLDVEWNPWLSFSELDVTPGTLNVTVPIIWKMRKFGSWELRSTFAVGAAILLTDFVEADKFSVGPFVGWNPLGVAFSFGSNFKLVVKPGDIQVPVPEIVGFPFYYHQYRFTVGLEWYP